MLKGIVAKSEMRMALDVRLYINSLSSKVWALLIAGTRLIDRAAVKIVAKLIRGTAIPFR